VRVFVAGGGTGGHLYPGLAIARAMTRLDPSVRPLFIGAKRGIERELLPKTEFEHTLLDLHPLYRGKVWENWRTLAGVFGAWRAIGRLVAAERPAVVVGTGGYAAGAALAYAAAHRIPIVQHAGDSFPGLTARAFARFTKIMFLGFPEAEKILSHRGGTRFVDSGNPIEPPPIPRPDRVAARARWGFAPTSGHVLLVYGGSQGSEALNRVVDAWVERGVPAGLNVIWGTGARNAERYASRESERVRVRGYLSPISEAYAASDLALARAGAMTTSELCAWGIPMILVPLPTAAADHQSDNAHSLASAGAAIDLPQSGFTVDLLERTVASLLTEPTALARLAAAARARGRPDAAERIAMEILTLARGEAIFRAPNVTTR